MKQNYITLGKILTTMITNLLLVLYGMPHQLMFMASVVVYVSYIIFVKSYFCIDCSIGTSNGNDIETKA
jgi:hypothetical protein